MKILHVISDPLDESISVNKRIANYFIHHLKRMEPEISILGLDLYQQPPPYLDKTQIDCIWRPLSDSTYTLSEKDQLATVYIEQQTELFRQVDHVIISAPVWNNFLPAILKAWIDQVICPGRVFEFGETSNQPLHRVVSMVNVISAGGFLSERGLDKPIFQLLKAPFEFIGVKRFYDVMIEGQEPAIHSDCEAREQAAKEQVEHLISHFRSNDESK